MPNLIGREPHQVPVCGYLGTAAFMDKDQFVQNGAAVALAGGAIDCALGNDFTETVNGNRTLAFSNVPAGAYSCVLEINHVSGTLTMPAGTVWAGPVPTLATGKRHLIFFQRAQLGTAGWYASALAGYSA